MVLWAYFFQQKLEEMVNADTLKSFSWLPVQTHLNTKQHDEDIRDKKKQKTKERVLCGGRQVVQIAVF